jgi:hypothetical protein
VRAEMAVDEAKGDAVQRHPDAHGALQSLHAMTNVSIFRELNFLRFSVN